MTGRHFFLEEMSTYLSHDFMLNKFLAQIYTSVGVISLMSTVAVEYTDNTLYQKFPI